MELIHNIEQRSVFFSLCTHIYIYIYIYIEREREREEGGERESRLWSLEMDTVTRVQILDEAVCIAQSVDTIEKGINSTILVQSMGKQLDMCGYLIIV